MAYQLNKILDYGIDDPIARGIFNQFVALTNHVGVRLDKETKVYVQEKLLNLAKALLHMRERANAFLQTERKALARIDSNITRQQIFPFEEVPSRELEIDAKQALEAGSSAISVLCEISGRVLSERVNTSESLLGTLLRRLPEDSPHRSWLNEDGLWLKEFSNLHDSTRELRDPLTSYRIEKENDLSKPILTCPTLRGHPIDAGAYLTGLAENLLTFSKDVLFLLLLSKCAPGFCLVRVPDEHLSENGQFEYFIETPNHTFQDYRADRLRHRSKYGKIPPIVSTVFNGERFVAVGPTLYHSKSWKTVSDFLSDYIKTVLTSEWGNAELAKPLPSRHQILQWYNELCHSQRNVLAKLPSGVFNFRVNGPAKAYLLLAYDLFLVGHHAKLQKRLIQRLKHPEHFQGARYELFAAATCVRAGCVLGFQDEDNRSVSHFEFTATHTGTGQILSVEAKSRSSSKLRFGRLINRASAKLTSYPHVIFIDLNLPTTDGEILKKPWVRRMQRTLQNLGKGTKENPDPYNLIIFTNRPHEYGIKVDSSPQAEFVGVQPLFPLRRVSHAQVIMEIYQAALQYGNVPNFFEGEEPKQVTP